ncbi:MAG: [Fe-Fe] hydrogenase large subunit C-terminal domain-containing protein, partial [Candidatus Cloacimonadota bacterium]|nr:[Fe-Fe] hydrogenase large subunit C-terminal domain-containing protein [Candidatus Cloacimonadota bacterium]
AKKGLLHLGFDEVAEESMVTEMMSRMIRDYIKKHPQTKPVISSNCPAIVRLIQVRFNSLLPNILKIEAPMSVLTMYYRNKIAKEKKLAEDDIGIFLIVPCVSQVTAVHQPEGAYKNVHDGAISIGEVYKAVMSNLKEVQNDENYIKTYPKGLSWAISGMEAEEVNDGNLRVLAVSGIHNVIKILHKIEDQQLDTYDFVVLHSCTNGCVGGVLNAEDPFVATSRIRALLRNAEHKDFADDYFYELYENNMFDVLPLEARSIMHLDSNIKGALEKMKKIREITQKLPGLDCSACGSPTCRALAEDIVAGKAKLDDCVVRLKKNLKKNEGKKE